jgi:hypothetical protein
VLNWSTVLHLPPTVIVGSAGVSVGPGFEVAAVPAGESGDGAKVVVTAVSNHRIELENDIRVRSTPTCLALL